MASKLTIRKLKKIPKNYHSIITNPEALIVFVNYINTNKIFLKDFDLTETEKLKFLDGYVNLKKIIINNCKIESITIDKINEIYITRLDLINVDLNLDSDLLNQVYNIINLNSLTLQNNNLKNFELKMARHNQIMNLKILNQNKLTELSIVDPSKTKFIKYFLIKDINNNCNISFDMKYIEQLHIENVNIDDLITNLEYMSNFYFNTVKMLKFNPAKSISYKGNFFN